MLVLWRLLNKANLRFLQFLRKRVDRLRPVIPHWTVCLSVLFFPHTPFSRSSRVCHVGTRGPVLGTGSAARQAARPFRVGQVQKPRSGPAHQCVPGPAWPGRGLAQCDQRPVRPQRRARSTSVASTWLSRAEGDEAPDQHHRIGAPLPTHLAADHTEGLRAPVRRLGPSATPVKNQSAKWNNSFYKVPALPQARLCWIDSCFGPGWKSIYAHLVQPDFFLRPD